MAVTYDNFDLRITRNRDIVATSREGEVGPVRLQCDLDELKLALALVEREQTNPELIRALGLKLYQAMFPPSILAHLERSRTAAPGRRVRLRLRFEALELAALPWELMHDGEKFFGLDPDTSITRYTEVSEPVRSLAVDGPLRILTAIASPTNFPELKRESIIEAFKAIFSQYQTDGLLEVEFLEHATYAGLVSLLRSSEFHVLHFVGYSGIDSATGQPVLMLEHENGTARRVSAEELGVLLYQEDMGRLLKQAQSLHLVVINDVESTPKAAKNHSMEVAAVLLRNGIPAVIAMQNSLPEAASRKFAAEFYAAIARGFPVDTAVVKGRMAIRSETGGEEDAGPEQVVAGEWVAPVLLLHAEDGQLFQPQRATDLAFLASSVQVYAEIEKFRVETHDWLTRFVLNYLPAFTIFGCAGLGAYLILASQPDFMFISGVAVLFLAIWLLNVLFRRKMPDTLDRLWRQRIINPRNNANLAQEYLKFLNEYNGLLNHKRYVWATCGPVLGIAIFMAVDFKPVGPISPQWEVPLRIFILIFESLAGYVIGTLLWKMIATVIMTTRLSYRFDLDIRPTHPDKCGGLRHLGDLYFEHVKIVLVAGLYVAVWVVLLTLANAVMEQRVRNNYPLQAALVADYPGLCSMNRPVATPQTSGLPPGFALDVCTCLEQEPNTELQAQRQQVLRCIEVTARAPQPLVVAVAYSILEFYRWLWFYTGLLGVLVLVAIVTFILPMYNTHRIMQRRGEYFRHKAYSLAGEIADLERYIERHGASSAATSVEISRRLEWLQMRYQQYVNPPMWPFDTRVRFRMLGSLGTMVFSWLLSETVPIIISSLQ